MRTLLRPRALALGLAILLVLLLALAGILWWRVSASSPALDAQVRAAERLLAVRASLADGVVEDPEGALEARIDEQLAALSPVARDHAAEPGGSGSAESPARVFDDSARELYEIASSEDLAPRQSALLNSIAVSHWLTARDLEGALRQVPDPASGAAASLAELLGEPPSDDDLSAGLCPDGTAAEDPRSEAVGSVLAELYATTWADDVLLARAEADGLGPDQQGLLRGAAETHADQLDELRDVVPPGCEGIPQPSAAYALPETDPARLGTEEATALSQRTLAVLAADDAAAPSPAWRAWSVRWLAVNAALAADGGSVPALPGDPPAESAG